MAAKELETSEHVFWQRGCLGMVMFRANRGGQERRVSYEGKGESEERVDEVLGWLVRTATVRRGRLVRG